MISVCLALFNGEKYIKEQVVSILSQLSDDDELIISDNGSTDSSVDIVKAVKDKRVRLIHCHEKGVVKNFNNCLADASNEFVFLADQDDIWLPSKVELMMRELANCDLVISNAVVIDQNAMVVNHSLFSAIGHNSNRFRNLWQNSYVGCCMAFRMESAKRFLPVPNKVMHDWYLSQCFLHMGTVSSIDVPLLKYRRHGGNESQTGDKSNNNLMEKFILRYHLITALLRIYFKYIFGTIIKNSKIILSNKRSSEN